MHLSASYVVVFLAFTLPFTLQAQSRCKSDNGVRVCTNLENQIVRVDHLLEDGRVEKRELYNPRTQLLKKTIYPRYAQDSRYSADWIEAFKVENARGQVIRSFDNKSFENCQGQIAKRHKLLVAEAYGIDLTHRMLRGKIAKAKSSDSVRTGSCQGFYVNSHDEVLPHAVGRAFNEDGFLDIDHATMVSTMALNKIENATLFPASGDLKSASFYQSMSEVIQERHIGLVNMSFSFMPKRYPHLTRRQAFSEAKKALTQVIYDNPKTLFVAASGNGKFGGLNYDAVNLTRLVHYPSGIRGKNLFSVGAINSSTIKIDKLSDYKMANFSNYSNRHVDILAPGVGMEAGQVGGGVAPVSGTSFASPYILNQVMKLSNIASHLSYLKIKELMMKTVYIPNIKKTVRYGLNWREKYTQNQKEKAEWFPVRSGGIYHPKRALRVAKKLAESPGMSLDQAVEMEFDAEEFLWRSRMWQRRGI